MSTFWGTLSGLAVYVSFVAVGALIGSRKAVRSHDLAWMGKIQFAALIMMVALLGVKLGANDEVVASLGQIGLMAMLNLVRNFFKKIRRYRIFCPVFFFWKNKKLLTLPNTVILI